MGSLEEMRSSLESLLDMLPEDLTEDEKIKVKEMREKLEGLKEK